MADQGKWFKLWSSSLNDPDLENLSLEDWARWAKLGAYIKAHGKDGKIRFTFPFNGLLKLFQTDQIAHAKHILKTFPNCVFGERETTVSTETNATVSLEIEYTNWLKYQGDFSSDRVRKYRDKKRHDETAQEEKRRRREVDEKRREEKSISSDAQASGVAELVAYFHFKLTEKLGEKPTRFNGGALGRTLKAALSTHTVVDVKGRIDAWFASTDPFIVSNAYSPTLFTSKFPILRGGPIHASKSNGPVKLVTADAGRRDAYPD